MNTAAQNINTVFFDGLYKDVWRKIIPEGLTAAEVDFLMEMGRLEKESKVLDIMCGYGRHAILTCMNDDFYFNDLVNKAVLLKLQHKKSVRQFYPNPVKFSEKELNILKCIAKDKTTEEISKEVFLSPRTIETIRQKMKEKVGAKTIAGLVMYAMRNKLLD